MRYRFAPLLLLGLCLTAPAFAAKSLLVDLSKSTVFALEDGKVVRALVINPGGSDTPTRPGKYRITQKVREGYRSNLVDVHNQPLKKGALGAPMDFWMRLGGTGMGFHRSSLWRPNGRWGSHGCMRMSRAGARWLFDWTPKGTPVSVVTGGSLFTSAVRSKNRTIAERPSRLKTATLAKAKPARVKRPALAELPAKKPVAVNATAKRPMATSAIAKKPVVVNALAKKKVPVTKPVAEAVPPKPTLGKSQKVEPPPVVAPIEASDDEPVSEPNTQD